MSQDRLLELAQRTAGLDTELLDEDVAQILVRGERLGLTAGAIQRKHQLRTQALAQRMLAHERLELADQVPVFAELELGVDALLDSRDVQLLEPSNLGLRELLLREVVERRAAPERERFAQERRCLVRARRGRRLPQALESMQVELAAFDADHVARLLRDDRIVGRKRLPQLRHVVLQGVGRRCGSLFAPQLVDQSVGRDDAVGMCEQQREERSHR